MSSAPHRRVRETLAAWEREGCAVLAVESARGDHFRLTIVLPDGRQVRALAAASASCPRAALNTRARVRRALRGVYGDGVTLLDAPTPGGAR
jgi:hypothetical protein